MDLKKGHAEEHENDERWLITYADLITLLMVFFVVMYSMSRTDAEKFKALASGLSQVFGKPAVSSIGVGGQPIAGNSILPNRSDGDARKGSRGQPKEGDVRTRRMQTLKSDLDSLMEKRGLSKSVTTKVDPKGPKLVMELSDSLLFDPGSAELTPAAIELLKPVGEVLGARDYNIHVEGHTDNVPISGRYKNNFELSAARAVNVITTLTKTAGLPQKMFSASGYGEYRPVATNDTPEGRAKNRRVDFVIYDENALDAMLGSMPSDAPVPEDAAGGSSHEESAGPAPAPAQALSDESAGPHETAPATTENSAHPAPASEGTAHAQPTTSPKLDTPVSTHASGSQEASLSSILALPPARPGNGK